MLKNIEDVRHIAKLANLNLTDGQLLDFMLELNPVLEYFNKLNEVDTENVEPTYHPISNLKNRFQEDGMDSALDIKDVTKNAKDKDGNYILTGAVL